MKSSEILEKAAEYIGEHGWCQGRLEDEEGRVCAVGAINAVAPLETDPQGLSPGLWVLSLIRFSHGGIPDYNDDPDTTAEDVILTFKRAAQAAREQGE